MTRSARFAPSLGALVALTLGGAPASANNSPLTFEFTKGQSLLDLEAGTPLEQIIAANIFAGFEAAGEVLRSVLHDPVKLNFTIEVDGLPDFALGQAIPEFTVFDYSPTLLPAMLADGTSADDALAAQHLPLPLPTGVEFMTHDTTSIPAPRIRDNDGSGNNTALILPRANAKALGLVTPVDSVNDGTIRIRPDVAWDFDRSDGVPNNRGDFIGVVVHEIGHHLGFFSGVELLDIFGGDGVEPEGPLADQFFNLNDDALFFPIDLFRYTADSLSQPNQPHGGLRDWSFGEPAPGDTPWFSIDGGSTALATFSTGSFNGDGFGPSHWEDDLGFGSMDPTIEGGLRELTALDLQAFDVIGWDLIPEPGTAVLLTLAGVVLAQRSSIIRVRCSEA